MHITVVTRFNVFPCPCQQVNHGSLSTTHAYAVTYPFDCVSLLSAFRRLVSVKSGKITKVLVIRIILVIVLVIVTKISLDGCAILLFRYIIFTCYFVNMSVRICSVSSNLLTIVLKFEIAPTASSCVNKCCYDELF